MSHASLTMQGGLIRHKSPTAVAELLKPFGARVLTKVLTKALTKLATALWLATVGTGVYASELLITTEELPPFNMMVNGKIVGSAADKVSEIMRRTEQPYRMDMMPWARAIHLAEVTPNSCVFSTTRSTEREPRFKWIGPLATNFWTLYGLADRSFYLKSEEDARPLRIGTYLDDVEDVYLRGKHFNVDSAQSPAVNPQKLMLGRIDLWAAGSHEAQALIEKNHLSGKIVPVLVFNKVDLYLACNPGVAADTLQKMSNALDQMNHDGTAAAIEKRYE